MKNHLPKPSFLWDFPMQAVFPGDEFFSLEKLQPIFVWVVFTTALHHKKINP